MSWCKKTLFVFCVLTFIFNMHSTFAKSHQKTHPHKPLLMHVTAWQDPSTNLLVESVPNNPPYPWKYFALPHTNDRLQMAPFINADLTPKLMEKTTAGEEGNYFSI